MPPLVALAFSVQIVEAVPLSPWDVRIPQVLTERERIVTADVQPVAGSPSP
jgi:5-formyltetrahydrofolate cyclo-ligase